MIIMTFSRRRKQKTDYEQRLGLLKSGKPRIVIRRALENIRIQFIISEEKGDKTVVETTSRDLTKYGWKGHGGNLPSAYLTGYLAGLRAAKHGIKEAVVDIGLQKSVKFSALYAAALGARDAGVHVNVGKSVTPPADRISGKHVAAFAGKLKAEPEKYRRQFSGYLKEGLPPEDLPKHFEEVKHKITAGSGENHAKVNRENE